MKSNTVSFSQPVTPNLFGVGNSSWEAASEATRKAYHRSGSTESIHARSGNRMRNGHVYRDVF